MEIEVIKGDITKLAVGAIVNASDKKFSGAGGVDLAIHRAAGRELAEACDKLGGGKTGQAKITRGYKLPADYVIHTVGPVFGKEGGKEAELLADCYKNCFKLAKENGIRLIAFPAISTGTYGYPKKEAAQIAVAAVKEFCDLNSAGFDKIIFTCFDDENFKIYKSLLEL